MSKNHIKHHNPKNIGHPTCQPHGLGRPPLHLFGPQDVPIWISPQLRFYAYPAGDAEQMNQQLRRGERPAGCSCTWDFTVTLEAKKNKEPLVK